MRLSKKSKNLIKRQLKPFQKYIPHVVLGIILIFINIKNNKHETMLEVIAKTIIEVLIEN